MAGVSSLRWAPEAPGRALHWETLMGAYKTRVEEVIRGAGALGPANLAGFRLRWKDRHRPIRRCQVTRKVINIPIHGAEDRTSRADTPNRE